MPFDIAALRKRGVEVEIDIFGDKLTVTYNPLVVGQPGFREKYIRTRGELTEANRKRVSKKGAGAGDLAASVRKTWEFWADTVCSMLVSWDAVDKGKEIPISPETFLGSETDVIDEDGQPVLSDALVPPEVANRIADAIWEDYNSLGNPKALNGSNSG